MIPRKTSLSLLSMVSAGLLLAGCVQEVPIVSTSPATTNMTYEEQQAWVVEQLELGIDASEVPDGWYWGSTTKIPWISTQEDRANIMGSWFPHGCDGTAGRLDVSLKNLTAEEPLVAAEKVRTYWEREGWRVSDVWHEPSPASPHFRADGKDGELLAFRAEQGGMTLRVYSACSAHDTVTDWGEYPPNEPTSVPTPTPMG